MLNFKENLYKLILSCVLVGLRVPLIPERKKATLMLNASLSVSIKKFKIEEYLNGVNNILGF